MTRETWEQQKLRRLEKVAQHLDIALGEFSRIAGGSYVGSLSEYHKLVRLRLSLESILRRVRAGHDWESRKFNRRSKS